MALFVFIGHSPIKSALAKEVAKRKEIPYTSTYDYSVKTELVKGILKRLNSNNNIILDVKHRTNEVFRNSFISKLKDHFVIYFVLSGKDNEALDLVRKWPDYLIFNFEQQTVELLFHMIGEILQLTTLFAKYKPFQEIKDKSIADNMFSIEPLDALNKIPISGLYYLMLAVINKKSIGSNITLKEVISSLMHFNSIPTKTMVKGIPILRVRFNEMNSSEPILFKKVSQLWHPPKHKTKKGRFNREKQPVLYTSDNLFTCFYETYDNKLHGKEGYVTALSCLINEDIKEGYISSIDTHVSPGKNIFYDSFVRFYKGKISENELLIKNFLGNFINSNKVFTPNFDYEITNLISDCIYKNNKIQAIMYPSTKINMQYNNVIFDENNAKKYVKPHGVFVYAFSINSSFEVSLKPVYFGQIKNGSIDYKTIDRPSMHSVVTYE